MRASTLGRIGGLTVFALLVAGGASLLHGQPAPAPADPSTPQALAENRVAIARKALRYLDNQISAGMISGRESHELRSQWSRRLYDAEIAAARDQSGKLAAAQEYLESCRKAMDVAKIMAQTGQISAVTLSEREYEVADAEYMLAVLKSQ